MRAWLKELAALAILLAGALGVGVLLSMPGTALLVAALGYLGWHFAQLARFWLQLRGAELRGSCPPGIWGDVWRAVRHEQLASRKASKDLARFNSRFRDATRAFPDPLVLLSKAFRVTWCNPAAERALFNQPLQRVRGGLLVELINQPELSAFLDAGDFTHPLILQQTHGRSRVLSIRLLPFGRKKRQRLFVASDITRIHHLDTTHGDFVANLSHELRTPLTVLAGYLEPLGEWLADDPDWSAAMKLMLEQTTRMRGMIDEISLLSQLEFDMSRNDTHIDICALIDEVVQEARAMNASAGHQVDVAADPGLQLLGVRSDIHGAVSNLVINALRHTPIGTRIAVSWQDNGEGAEITVIDDGPGIGASHLPRLTERFYRVDAGRSRDSGGTGLGLAIVRHALERHNARLRIESVPGRGSTFRCEFPQSRVVRVADEPARQG